MALFITSLNSGSNGNCFYVGNQHEAILVDAGISCREIERRMMRLGLSMQTVKAVVISHEHSDHVRGLPVLVKKYQLPCYITAPTHHNGNLNLDEQFIKTFRAHEPVTIGQLTITAFPKLHDASDPYSFVVDCNNVKVGIFTDIGSPCQHVIRYFKQCHAAFLEANYDEDMLANGRYPIHLKRRISSNYGHLSNRQALDLFQKHRPAFMSHLFLSHLSQENNHPQLVEDLFKTHAAGTEIVIASRYKETSVYTINGSAIKVQPVRLPLASSQLQFAF